MNIQLDEMIKNGKSDITRWATMYKFEFIGGNDEQEEDVDTVIELVRKAGGKIVKEPQEVFWGGYHAYFLDLDGYYWEVSWGPNFQFDENGLLTF